MFKLTPHDTTEDAQLLVTTMLEAEPSTFDPEAELTRLTTYTCPECRSTNTTQPDEEGLSDCLECGIWFDPYHQRNRPPLDGLLGEAENQKPDPSTPEELQAYALAHGLGPPRKNIKEIKTTTDYREYESRVRFFLMDIGVRGLSPEPGAEPFFSWARCDCCYRDLGGSREECSGFNETTREVQTGYSLCSDCVYYLAYGQLDDQTMLNITDDTKANT